MNGNTMEMKFSVNKYRVMHTGRGHLNDLTTFLSSKLMVTQEKELGATVESSLKTMSNVSQLSKEQTKC